MSEGRVEGTESSNSRSQVLKRTEHQTSKTHASEFRPQKKEKWCNGTASGQEKAWRGRKKLRLYQRQTRWCCLLLLFFLGYFICLECEWFLILSLKCSLWILWNKSLVWPRSSAFERLILPLRSARERVIVCGSGSQGSGRAGAIAWLLLFLCSAHS